MKKRLMALVCALVLVLTMMPVSAAEDVIYIVAINDTVPEIQKSTMPFWSGGYLYVSCTAFQDFGIDYNSSAAKQTLLLYRSGFYVGKYISLEAKIAKNKDLYYDVLRQAQIGWHEGTEDVVPFIKYLLGIILSAYKDFEDRFALVDTKLPAMETVRRATMEKIGRFTKQDIRELCPSISISSIEGALRKLVASGELKREGAGKKICYYRLK